jgi:hypothetical protein
MAVASRGALVRRLKCPKKKEEKSGTSGSIEELETDWRLV